MYKQDMSMTSYSNDVEELLLEKKHLVKIKFDKKSQRRANRRRDKIGRSKV